MPCYESVLIARQDISSQQVDGIADQMTALIEENGGKVANREYWGLRKLAYKVKKNRKGHYVQFNIDAPAPAIHEMERQLRLHEDVLRYLTIRVDELSEEPSVIMQNKDRGDRPERGRGRRDDRPQRDDNRNNASEGDDE